MLKFLSYVILFLLGYRYLKLWLAPKAKEQNINVQPPHQDFDDGEYIDYEEVE